MVQTEKTKRYDKVRKVIHYELKLKFDLTTKWYKDKPESLPDNKMR